MQVSANSIETDRNHHYHHSDSWEALKPSDFVVSSSSTITQPQDIASPKSALTMAATDHRRKRSPPRSVVSITASSSLNYSVWIGLILRFALAWLLPWAMDEGNVLPGVEYTDIDYHVFTDAAAYAKEGESPFLRTTYRYTPFLAALLAYLPAYRISARYLFCLADTICGWIIVQMRRKQRRSSSPTTTTTDINNDTTENHPLSSSRRYVSVDLEDALWWLYNPLAVNICTRGSAESLIVLMPVLLTVSILTMTTTNDDTTTTRSSYLPVIAAGICHGVAIHCKLYPIIYSLSFVCYIATAFSAASRQQQQQSIIPTISNVSLTSLSRYILEWAQRLLAPAPVLFALAFSFTTVGLSWMAVHQYGFVALQEGLLYHFGRVDHRHNYSMHWYWIYLGLARSEELGVAGILLLLPQAILLVVSSLQIAPRHLSLALFVQTFLFVAQNKVITAQYFTWYLCLLPLCSNSLNNDRRVLRALTLLIVSILLWLGSAFCLEMQGMGVHRIVWAMSVLFFGANVNLLGALLGSGGSVSNDNARSKSNASRQGVKVE